MFTFSLVLWSRPHPVDGYYLHQSGMDPHSRQVSLVGLARYPTLPVRGDFCALGCIRRCSSPVKVVERGLTVREHKSRYAPPRASVDNHSPHM